MAWDREMNRDDIIRMAREADFWLVGMEPYQTQLERFAKLVAANDTALLRQLLALCSKEGGWTLEEAANTICEIENILLARLEGEQ
jgi:hypothetical protein